MRICTGSSSSAADSPEKPFASLIRDVDLSSPTCCQVLHLLFYFSSWPVCSSALHLFGGDGAAGEEDTCPRLAFLDFHLPTTLLSAEFHSLTHSQGNRLLKFEEERKLISLALLSRIQITNTAAAVIINKNTEEAVRW